MHEASSIFVVVVIALAGGAFVGCSKSEPKPEATAASAPAPTTSAPIAKAVTTEAAGAPKNQASANRFTTVDVAPLGEEEKVSACHGDDVRIAVPNRPGSSWKLVKHAPLGAPKQEYAAGWLSPTLGADKYTFSTKDVPAGTKEARIELQDSLDKGQKLVVKVDLTCAGGDALKLPGACVDPKTDATKRAKPFLHGTSVPLADILGEATAMDLDGDGTKDRIFAVGLGNTTAQFVYVMRGACGHYVGDLGGATVKVLPTKHAGLPDLAAEDSTHCEGSLGPCEPNKSKLVFDGTGYKTAK